LELKKTFKKIIKRNMNEKLTNIIEELKTLSLLEAVALVKEIEKTFEVDSSVSAFPVSPFPVGNVALSTGNLAAPSVTDVAEEKSSFDILLTEVPADKKIAILKIIRNVTGLGLKESKDIVDNVPKLVKEGTTKEESENIKKELEAAGAKVNIK
jgi:large subunit ribosomal protein L7/L12